MQNVSASCKPLHQALDWLTRTPVPPAEAAPCWHAASQRRCLCSWPCKSVMKAPHVLRQRCVRCTSARQGSRAAAGQPLHLLLRMLPSLLCSLHLAAQPLHLAAQPLHLLLCLLERLHLASQNSSLACLCTFKLTCSLGPTSACFRLMALALRKCLHDDDTTLLRCVSVYK